MPREEGCSVKARKELFEKTVRLLSAHPAFSGAKEFAEKYKEYMNKDSADVIIGHLGLGFSLVEILTY